MHVPWLGLENLALAIVAHVNFQTGLSVRPLEKKLRAKKCLDISVALTDAWARDVSANRDNNIVLLTVVEKL